MFDVVDKVSTNVNGSVRNGVIISSTTSGFPSIILSNALIISFLFLNLLSISYLNRFLSSYPPVVTMIIGGGTDVPETVENGSSENEENPNIIRIKY